VTEEGLAPVSLRYHLPQRSSGRLPPSIFHEYIMRKHLLLKENLVCTYWLRHFLWDSIFLRLLKGTNFGPPIVGCQK